MPSTGALKWLVITVWLLMAGQALAVDQLIVITLKHRLANDLVAQIQPLLGQSGAVSGRGDKLLVRGSASQLESIRAVVAELDTPTQSLLITVAQGGGFDRAGLRAEFGFSARAGDLSVATGGLPAPGVDGVAVAGSVGSWRTSQRDSALQRVRATAGYPAWISTGRSDPYRAGGYDEHGHYRDNVVFRDSDTGFSVLPQVLGERVSLQIGTTRARLDSAVPGAIVGSGLSTRVSGALGDWIEVGGLSGASREHTGAGGATDQRRELSGGQVWLRVQVIQP